MSIESIKVSMQRELTQEKQIVKYMESRLNKMPEGALTVRIDNDNKRYYQYVNYGGKKRGICLNPMIDDHRKTIIELMEKKTIVHGKPILQANIHAMEKCLSKIKPYHPMNYKYGQYLGESYYPDDEVCVREWLKKQDNMNPLYPERRIHETKKGVNVRSKSEVMISDTFFDYGILYKNETLLCLGGRNVYPDFEILHPKTYRRLWWEHLGMIDDLEYVRNALDKILLYASNGIIPGDNLIITLESQDRPLTHGVIDQKMREFGLI